MPAEGQEPSLEQQEAMQEAYKKMGLTIEKEVDKLVVEDLREMTERELLRRAG